MRKGAVFFLFVLTALAASASAAMRHRERAESLSARALAEKISAGKTYGLKTAPIRIDEYSDFECPHCQALFRGTLQPLIQEYVANGKVYLVHHDFPLPLHPYARKAADYAAAAAVIGRFEIVEQALFAHQAEWATTGKVEPFVAAVLSLEEMKQVNELARNSEVQAAVQHDLQQGEHLGITETPTMYINYKGRRTPIIGVVSYPILRRYLDALLHQ